MVYNYLVIQETSISSEQVFSITSHTITKVHNYLNFETACTSLCLKNWMKQNASSHK